MPKSVSQSLVDNAPWKPPKYGKAQAVAIQMLAQGQATEGQQQMALDWIINECCKTYDMSYRPDNQKDQDFAEGKRYVGNEIIKLIKVKIGQLKE